MRVAYPPELLASIEGADPRRTNILFFSTQGRRSLADRIAGKDYDGDVCLFIGWPELVNLFEVQSDPYDPKYPPDVQPDPPRVGRKRKASASAANGDGAVRAHASTSADCAVATSANLTPASASKSGTNSAPDLEQRLTCNFLVQRFLTSPLVGTAGTQWKAASDGHADSATCLALDHLYKRGLDASPPDLSSLSDVAALREHMSQMRLPSKLRTNRYPEFMDDAIDESNKRAAAAGKPSRIVTIESRSSLLGKLWHAPSLQLAAAGNNAAPTVHLDHMLMRGTWPREQSPLRGMPGYDDAYLQKWRENFDEYSRREHELPKKSDPPEEDGKSPSTLGPPTHEHTCPASTRARLPPLASASRRVSRACRPVLGPLAQPRRRV